MNEVILESLDLWGRETTLKIILALNQNNAIATGRLRNSINYRIGPNGVQFLMEAYGKFIDEGTRPSNKKPSPEMITSIRRWSAIKGIPPEAAFPVAKKILRTGKRPRPFFQSVIEKELNNLVLILEDEVIEYLGDRIRIIEEEA